MSYLVLARKWRPQTFKEVVGQEPIVRTLQNAIRGNRVAQAFLFTGPRGVGKTSVARILAKALNCVQGPTPTPCNVCEACTEIAKTIAPDVFEIDGASNTGVDHVRDLQETLRYLPQKSRHKIFIVDEVHMLSTPAFNAFLKTLEEPPRHVVFIFATTEPHKIIETVIDRCQRYDFKKIAPARIQEHLEQIVQQENITISASSLQLIAREADGSLRDAQSMLDQVVTYAGLQVRDEEVTDMLGVVESALFFEVAGAILNADPAACLHTVEKVLQQGVDLRQFYRGLMEHVRNLMMARVSTDPRLFPDLTPNLIADVAAQAEAAPGLEYLQGLFKLLMESEGYLYRASLPRVVLEAILLRLATLPQSGGIKEILSRLAALQERLGGVPRAAAPPDAPAECAQEAAGPRSGLKVAAECSARGLAETPAASSASSGSLEHCWKEFRAFVRNKKAPLASWLDEGRLAKKTEGSLEIEFPDNFLFVDRLQEAGKKRELQALAEEFCGRKVSLVISVAPAESFGTGDQKERLSRAQMLERTRQEARSHPLVKEALILFQGQITEIKVSDS